MDDNYKSYLKVFSTFEDKVKNMDDSIFGDIAIINYCLDQDEIIYVDTIIKLYSKVYVTTIYHCTDDALKYFFDKCLNAVHIPYIYQIKLNIKLNAAHHENYINQVKFLEETTNKISYIEEFLGFDLSLLKSEDDIKLFTESAIQFALQINDDILLNEAIKKVL